MDRSQLLNALREKFSHIEKQLAGFAEKRIQMAIDTGAKTDDEIAFLALYAPLLEPNTYAIRAVKEIIPSYLDMMGDDLNQYHDAIIELAIEYHEHILYPSVSTSRSTKIKSHDPKYSEINTWEGFASELYHRIPLPHDWDAVANFIITDSTEHGKALRIQAEHGDDELVYKAVLSTGCQSCKNAYQQTGKPKTFRVKELIQSNRNSIEQRIYDEQSCCIPTSGPNHLYCTCQLYKYTGHEPWAHK